LKRLEEEKYRLLDFFKNTTIRKVDKKESDSDFLREGKFVFHEMDKFHIWVASKDVKWVMQNGIFDFILVCCWGPYIF
jgi:hypothetical protein